jgi:hypothetical protein
VHDEVPVRVWWLAPIERWVVPETCATCPTKLGDPDVRFVRLGEGDREAPVICVPCRDRMQREWVGRLAESLAAAEGTASQMVGEQGDRIGELEAEAERLRASAEGAHRRINEVLDYVATKDAVKLSEDAGAMGFHIVALLDSPPTRADEEAVHPALPWASLLTDAEASDLVSELASLFLDYWRGDRPDDVATLRDVGQLLAQHRDQAARELAHAVGAGESR